MVRVKKLFQRSRMNLLDKHFSSCHSCCQMVKKGWVRYSFDSDFLNTFCRVYNRLDCICDVFQTNRDDEPDDGDVCELPYANDPYGWRNAYARQSCPHCYRLSRSLGYQTAHQLLLWAAQLSQWYFHLLSLPSLELDLMLAGQQLQLGYYCCWLARKLGREMTARSQKTHR